MQIDPMAALLMLMQQNPQMGVMGLPGQNMMPAVGQPLPVTGGQQVPQQPIPAPVFPSQTRGEAATAVRSDIGSLLSGI